MKTIDELEESNGIKVDKEFDLDEFIGKTIVGKIPNRVGLRDLKITFNKDYWLFDMIIYLKGSFILVDYQEFPVSYRINGIPEEITSVIKEVVDSDIDIFNSIMGIRSNNITIDAPTITVTTGNYEYPNTLTYTDTSISNGNFIATSSSSSIFEDSLSDLGTSLVNITNNYVKSKL